MSWHSAKKRFQKDIEKLPRALADHHVKKMNDYALPTFENKFRQVPKHERKTKLEDIGVASGDFAYITKGPHAGTITTIFNYSPELDTVLMANVNGQKIIPKHHWVENQSSHLMDYPEPMPLENIKLAGKDKDEFGRVYYVVADEVVYKDRYYDERYRKWLPRRMVKNHESIELPWPNPPSAPQDDALSTPEEVAHEKTWEWQSLAKSPVPQDVLNQLRNPHSKYKRKILNEVEAKKLNAPEMPLSNEQRIYLAKKAQADANKEPLRRLSPEIQDFIGAKIAAHLSKVDNPYLKAHLDALSNSTIPDFAKTMAKIEEAERKSAAASNN